MGDTIPECPRLVVHVELVHERVFRWNGALGYTSGSVFPVCVRLMDAVPVYTSAGLHRGIVRQEIRDVDLESVALVACK